MKLFKYGLLGLGATPLLVVAGIMLAVIILFAAASAPFGWMFGGGAPNHTPSANQAPAHAPNLYTPTPIPSDCFVTPTPVAVTVTPAAAPPGATPPNTPPGGATAQVPVVYLPTATPCPIEYYSTPNPGDPPTDPGSDGSYDIRQGSISTDEMASILKHYPLDGGPNPLTGVIQNIFSFQSQYHINAVYMFAQFVMESSMCTTGISPSAIECGNIVWTEGGHCATHNVTIYHDFCGYASWAEAAEAWFRLMAGYYIPNGLTTVHSIIYTYAPCSDNGGCDFTDHYIKSVEMLVNQWGGAQAIPANGNDDIPHGSPFHTGPAGYWVTQAYGCTDFQEFFDQQCASSTGRAQPYFHRGIDIVSKGDKQVFSTLNGSVTFAGVAGGFGNAVYVKNGPYLVIFPHLAMIYAAVGEQVKRGTLLGIEGTTGYSTGDHLHYEIHINGAWVDSTSYLNKP